MDEQNESPEESLPEDEADLLAELEDKRGRELTEKERTWPSRRLVLSVTCNK
jgi:hypothetical protein